MERAYPATSDAWRKKKKRRKKKSTFFDQLGGLCGGR